MKLGLGDPVFEDKRPILPPKLKKPVFITAGFVAVAILGLVVGGVVASSINSAKVPDGIAQQAKSPVYLPSQLPSGYSIDQSSFMFSEDTVLFTAANAAGSKLIFTQQAKPQGFDFDSFHSGQLQEPKALEGSKYTSVWGKAADNRLLLSVVTDETWIIMTTSALLNEGDMRNIAQGLRK